MEYTFYVRFWEINVLIYEYFFIYMLLNFSFSIKCVTLYYTWTPIISSSSVGISHGSLSSSRTMVAPIWLTLPVNMLQYLAWPHFPLFHSYRHTVWLSIHGLICQENFNTRDSHMHGFITNSILLIWVNYQVKPSFCCSTVTKHAAWPSICELYASNNCWEIKRINIGGNFHQ